MSVNIKNALVYGDSASAGNVPLYFLRAVGNTDIDLWTWQRIAVGGRTVATAQDNVDAELAAITGTIHVVLFNLGKNDADDVLVEANWKADLAYILDAMRTKWSDVTVIMMRAWRQGYGTECSTLATWTDSVIASRTWAIPGPDERVFLENGDNGATYTSDGVHPNTAGEIFTGQQWALYIP